MQYCMSYISLHFNCVLGVTKTTVYKHIYEERVNYLKHDLILELILMIFLIANS